MLELDHVNTYYGCVHALQDVSMSIDEAEIVAVIGPNGSGKTTLLKTIQGLLRPSFGSINFLGQRIDKLPPHEIVELGITYVPEDKGFFPHMSVLENLELGAYTKKTRRKTEENIELVYQLFPILEKKKNDYASELSGGEQKMLVLGCGLISGAKLLLLDDPFLGLAPKIILCTCEIIKRVNDAGITILLTGQHVRQILGLANKGYLLESGRITIEGSNLLENDHVRKTLLGLV